MQRITVFSPPSSRSRQQLEEAASSTIQFGVGTMTSARPSVEMENIEGEKKQPASAGEEHQEARMELEFRSKGKRENDSK